MTADSFSKVTAGIQSIAVVIGLLVGGWWTLKTFVFQNPAYYEQGSEVAGLNPTAIKASLSFESLDPGKKQYEITLTVANSSKSLGQLLWGEKTELVYFHPGESSSPHRATFFSTLAGQIAIEVPPSESRELRFLANFPEDGIYVLEADLCKRFERSCLAQKYIFVGSASH